MRFKTVLFFLLIFYFPAAHAQKGLSYVRAMYDQNKATWYRTIQFEQRTDIYRNDSLIKTSTWHEAGIFPYLFRIDFDRENRSGAIYTRDSTYRFMKGELKSVTKGTNPFTFLLGGMYQVPFDTVTAQLTKAGYDLNKGCETTWKGRKVWVIGADSAGAPGNQFWVDAQYKYLIRTIEKDEQFSIDAWLSNHVKLQGGWSEQKAEIYIDGKLRQVETYSNIKVNVPLDQKTFDPHYFGQTML